MSRPVDTDGRHEPQSPARRRVLRATAAGLSAALAGCSGDGGTDTGDGGNDSGDGNSSPGGPATEPAAWPMRGRTPGRTYATPATVPTSLDELRKLSPAKGRPVVTDAGVLTQGRRPLTLVDPESGDAVWESEYQPTGEVFVVDGTAVFRGEGAVVGVSLEDGERAWRSEYEGSPFPAGDGFGYKRAFMADDADSGGEELGVVGLADREQRWKHRVSADFGSRSFIDPVVDVASGTVFTCDADVGKGRHPVDDGDHYLRAYDLASGEERWSKDGVYYPRAARNGRLLAARTKTRHQNPPAFEELVALGADGGSKEWGREAAQFGAEHLALDGEGVYVAADSTVYATDPGGEGRWSYRIQGSPKIRALAAAENGVVVGASSRVLVLDDEGSVAGEYDIAEDDGYAVYEVVPTGDRIYAVDRNRLGLVALSSG